TVARRRTGPVVLRRHRGLERTLPVGHRSVGHRAQDGPVGRVEYVEAATPFGVGPLAADEQAPLVVGKEVQTGHTGHFPTGLEHMTAGVGLCFSGDVDFGGSTAKSAKGPSLTPCSGGATLVRAGLRAQPRAARRKASRIGPA